MLFVHLENKWAWKLLVAIFSIFSFISFSISWQEIKEVYFVKSQTLRSSLIEINNQHHLDIVTFAAFHTIGAAPRSASLAREGWGSVSMHAGMGAGWCVRGGQWDGKFQKAKRVCGVPSWRPLVFFRVVEKTRQRQRQRQANWQERREGRRADQKDCSHADEASDWVDAVSVQFAPITVSSPPTDMTQLLSAWHQSLHKLKGNSYSVSHAFLFFCGLCYRWSGCL